MKIFLKLNDYEGMKIRLYKPVTLYLLSSCGNNRSAWETELSKIAQFRVSLPQYFWEIHLFLMNERIPNALTVECFPEKNWFSVFYSYNLNGDLKKYLETLLIRKCKKQRAAIKIKN